MRIIRSVADLREAVGEARRRGDRVGLVPTMGAFHEGHLALMRRARQRCQFVVVSLFVNPTQFNEQADLARYPRDEVRDAAMAREEGVNVMFAPDAAEVYPDGFATYVEVDALARPLEGVVRGTQHFRGVATVVAKLLNMAQPDHAFFGQKDAQQALIIRRLARDLDVPVAIEVCPTVREPDGLAMSSRNVLLEPEHRAQATALSAALFAVRDSIVGSAGDVAAAMEEGARVLAAAGIEPEYLAAVSPDTLEPAKDLRDGLLVAIAARFGKVRLIDNVLIDARVTTQERG